MPTFRRVLAAAGLLACVFALLPSTADAQSRRRGKQSYANRHVTMAARTLRLDLGPAERSINDAGILLGPYSLSAYGLRFAELEAGAEDEMNVMLGLGLSYGIFDSLEIGVLAAPLNFRPDQVYGDLTPYLRWAFVNQKVFQMALQGTFQTPTWSDPGFGVGLPMNINAGRIARIEVGVELEMVLDDRDRDGDGDEEPRVAIDLPIALSFNVRPRGFFGVRTDLLFDELVGPGRAALRAGVGGHGGFTLFSRRAATTDLTAAFMGYFQDDIINWELSLGATVAFAL